MRRHAVSAMYNSFIYIYINLFLANGLARQTNNSCTELLVTTRAIIGQRGTLPVTPLGYLNPKKVIFRTMRTMRKQFPVNWLTSGRFSAPKRGGVNK